MCTIWVKGQNFAQSERKALSFSTDLVKVTCKYDPDELMGGRAGRIDADSWCEVGKVHLDKTRIAMGRKIEDKENSKEDTGG